MVYTFNLRILCEDDIRLLAQCLNQVLHRVPQSAIVRDIIQFLEFIVASLNFCTLISEVGDINHRWHFRCDPCEVLNQIRPVKYKINSYFCTEAPRFLALSVSGGITPHILKFYCG